MPDASTPDAWDDFVDRVLAAAPHPLGAKWEALLAPELVQDTRRALAELLADIQQATHENKREMPKHAYQAWLRETGLPTRRMLEERLREVKQITHNLHQAQLDEQRDEARAVAAKLACAINRHRLATVAAGLDPEPHDRALWAHLEVLIPYNGGRATLNEMIGRGVWTDDGIPPMTPCRDCAHARLRHLPRCQECDCADYRES